MAISFKVYAGGGHFLACFSTLRQTGISQFFDKVGQV